MAYSKKTWQGRQGVGLNKFSIDGATPVPIVNQPDSVTQQGDALSAGNLNDLENRIEDAFEEIYDGDVVVGKASKDADGNVIDTTYATKAEASNLNNAITQHEARIENLEQKAGDYSIVQYRGTNAVPTGKAKNALVENIVGKTRAWNQFCKNGNFADNSEWTTSNATLSISGNVATFRASATSGQIRNGTAMPLNNTHAYMFSLKVKGSSSFNQFNAIVSGAGAGTIAFNSISVTTSWQTLVGIFIPQNTQNGNIEIYDARTSGWDDIFISDVIFRDLGLIIPEYTASYIKNTLGVSGVVKQLSSDILTYDSYGYSLVSTTVSGVKSIGVNLWDEEWEVGNIQAGSPVPSTQYFRSKNFIRVEPSKSYYLYSGTNDNIYVFEYRMDLAYANVVTIIDSANHVFTTSANTWYVRFADRSRVAYGNDIQIVPNSLPDSVKQTYHPHTEFTLTLSTPVTLRSAGSVSDTDELNVEVNGVARRRQTTRTIEVDLSAQTWTVVTGTLYSATIQGVKPAATSGDIGNITCDKYIPSYVSGLSGRTGMIAVDTNEIRVNTGDANTPTGTAVVEIATYSETLSDPIINNTIATEGGGTIETIQTQTPVIDNSLDVGYLAV